MLNHPQARTVRANYLEFATEPLERRRMLAGNVEINVTSNGDLIINGDSQGNVLELRAFDSDTFRITGLSGTTINGENEMFFAADLDDIRINLREGQNFVTIRGDSSQTTSISGDLRIDFANDSNNDIIVRDVAVGGEIRGRSGNGSDIWSFDDTTFEERFRLDTRGGSDDIAVYGPNSSNLPGEVMDIRTGDGNDNVVIEYDGLGEMKINTGDGDDIFEVYLPMEELTVRSGDGNDLVYTSPL